MKFQFNLFGFEIQVDYQKYYESYVIPEGEIIDPDYIDTTYLGLSFVKAYFKGWQFARMYAKKELKNYTFVVNRVYVFDCDGGIDTDTEYMLSRTIAVKHQIAFFSR